jgi:hypothetical protein
MGDWWYSCTILDIGTRWRFVISFTPQPIYPRKRTSSTHWIAGWVGSTAGLDTAEKRKILACRKLNLGLPARMMVEDLSIYPWPYHPLLDPGGLSVT